MRWSLAVLCHLSLGTACTRTPTTPPTPAPSSSVAPSIAAAPTSPPAGEPACDASLTRIRYMMRRVKSRPDGAPLLPYARLGLDADGEQQLADLIARVQAHPDWHVEVAVHLDPATRSEAAPELVDERLLELSGHLRWPLRVIEPATRVHHVVHGVPDGPPEDPRAGAWIEVLRRCGPFPPDQDQDALPDTTDRCPDIAEDHDGFEDDDGCPDRDNDGDGILDAHTWTGTRWTNCDGTIEHGVELDCRNLPEDLDGLWDEDGCPDLVRLDREPAILEVQYDPNTLQLPPAALDPVIAHAAAHPDSRYWIDAHCDSRRTDKQSLALTRRLALAAVAELVRRGVAEARLEPRPFGESLPIADNKTPAGRKANNRLEVHVQGSTSVPAPQLLCPPGSVPTPDPAAPLTSRAAP